MPSLRRYAKLRRRKPLARGSKPLRRTRLRPVSKRRAAEGRTYSAKRRAFLAAHQTCQALPIILMAGHQVYMKAWSSTAATDVHHKAGRRGDAYLDETTWLAVCRTCHDWIHAHPAEARKLGLIVERKSLPLLPNSPLL